MLDLVVKQSNELNLDASEKKLFGRSLGGAIAKFFQDKNNLEKFKQKEEFYKKEVKRLEVERDSVRTTKKG